MNKKLPCYIVSDLLPLYQDDILSEQTKKDIDKHLNECEECKKKLAENGNANRCSKHKYRIKK